MKTAKTLDDLFLPKESHVDIPRGEDSIRIKIKAISAFEQDELAKRFKAPSPPEQFRKNPDTGKPEFCLNTADSAWITARDKANQDFGRGLLFAGMQMEIPGENVDEKWKNLSEKLTIGDTNLITDRILSLSNFNENKIEEVKNS